MRTTERATAPLTTTEAAVLCLLAVEGEQSGYDLLKKARDGVGYVWMPAKSRLYAVLPRLVDHGLALVREGGRDQGPDRQLYRISAAGRRTILDWLRTVEADATDAFMLRVFYGGLAPDAVAAQVEQYRCEAEERLALYRSIEKLNSRQGHDYYHHLLLRLGIRHARASIAWADDVLAELE